MGAFPNKRLKLLSLLTQNHGFTLLELLVSMTILGLMMAIIMGGFRLGTRAWEKGEAKADYNQKLRVVLDHLLEEIRSAHSLTITSEDDDTKYHAFWGEPERIRFITTVSGLQSEPGMEYTRAVEYFVEGGTGLVMRSTPCLGGDCFRELEDQDTVLLDSNVDVLSFRYCYIPEPEKGEEEQEEAPQCEWVTDWDPSQKGAMDFGGAKGSSESLGAGQEDETSEVPVQKLPHAVEITLSLEFAEENKNRQLPPLIVPIYLGQEVIAPKELL